MTSDIDIICIISTTVIVYWKDPRDAEVIIVRYTPLPLEQCEKTVCLNLSIKSKNMSISSFQTNSPVL